MYRQWGDSNQMTVITIEQGGETFIITTPKGETKINCPDGGTLHLDKPLFIKSING